MHFLILSLSTQATPTHSFLRRLHIHSVDQSQSNYPAVVVANKTLPQWVCNHVSSSWDGRPLQRLHTCLAVIVHTLLTYRSVFQIIFTSLCSIFTVTVEKAANKHQQENSTLAVEMDGWDIVWNLSHPSWKASGAFFSWCEGWVTNQRPLRCDKSRKWLLQAALRKPQKKLQKKMNRKWLWAWLMLMRLAWILQ